MTAHVRYFMTCDIPGCAAEFTIGERYATPTRAAAHVVGWTFRIGDRKSAVPSADICPHCSTKAAQ